MRIWVIISGILMLLVLVLLSISLISGDDDLFWHLATGRWIWERQAIPSTNVFGFVRPDLEWIPFEWGWDLMTFALSTIDPSLLLIQLLPAVAFTAIFGMMWRLLSRMGVHHTVILIVSLLVLAASLDRYTPRPHLITLLGLALVIFLHFSSRYFANRTSVRLFFLPPMFIVWANMHMGVFAGVFLLGLICISEWIIKWKSAGRAAPPGIPPLSPRHFRTLLVVTALCTLAVLVNPHGYHTIIYAYEHTQLQMLGAIKEWFPPFGDLPANGVLYVYKVLLFLSLISTLYAVRRKDPLPFIISLGFAVYSLKAVRFMADFSVVAMVGTALGVREVTHRSVPLVTRFMKTAFPLAAVCGVLSYVAYKLPTDKEFYIRDLSYYRHFGRGIDSNYFSMRAVEFLKTNQISGNPFHQLEIGGLLLWERPAEKNFIDTRNNSDALGREYYSLLLMESGFEQRLADLNIDYLVFHPTDMLTAPTVISQTLISYCSRHRDDWKLVYWDDLSMIYLKNLPKFKPMIDRYEYRLLHPYLNLYAYPQYDSLRRSHPGDFLKEMERKMSEEPSGVIIGELMRRSGM